MKATLRNILALAFLFATAALQAQTINSFTPQQINGGTGTILTISGSGFGATRGASYVSFYQESGAYSDQAVGYGLRYLGWTDTEIKVSMPTAYSNKIKLVIGGNAYYSADSLHVMANLTALKYDIGPTIDYQFLSNNNDSGGYTLYMHTSYWNDPLAKAAIEDVIKEFRCKTGVNYILASVPTTLTPNLSDSINVIAPDATLSDAGYCDRLWSSCILAGDTFVHTTRMDVRLNPALDWYYGTGAAPAGKAKFRYVLMHEIGHSMGLAHVNEPGQTMYPSVTNTPSNSWNARDILTDEESTALLTMVTASRNFTFSACGISPMLPFTNCNAVYGGTGTGIASASLMDGFRIWPNPVRSTLYVEMPSSLALSLSKCSSLPYSIIDPLGRTLQTGTVESGAIDVSGLTQGLYYIRIGDQERNVLRMVRE